MDLTAEKFSAYSANLNYADLTPAAVHAVKRSFVDSIGCALGAFNAGPMQAMRDLAAQNSSASPATVIGTRTKSSQELAAFANSSMIRYADFSDDYFGGNGDTGPHPSDNIGAILAAAEGNDSNGETLVLGTALAYEISGQLIDHTTVRGRGWDHPMLHAISSALAASRVMGLSLQQIRHALGIAVVSNVALFQTRLGELSNWKGLAGPNGSRNGLFAALLARQGFTGPAEPFEGKAGFMTQLNNRFELGALGGGPVPFKVEGTFFKYLPVVYPIQLPVWIAFALREKIRIAEIAALRVYLQKRQIAVRADHPEQWDPKSRESADHSGPFLIAAALIDGAITEDTFTAGRYRDPAVLALMEKISFEEDPQYTRAYPGESNCRFEVTLKSGERVSLHQKNHRGHPANPMTDGEIEDKFLRQVDAVLPGAQARALLDQLWNLEKVREVSALFPLMLARGQD